MRPKNQETPHTSPSRAGKGSAVVFSGYPAPTSNTTYVPNQFLDVVIRRSSRGTVRLVGYMLRRILGWSNADGSPRETQVQFSYNELMEGANISRGAIREAIDEALKSRYIVCLQEGVRSSQGAFGQSAIYELNWDESEEYITDPSTFRGFYAGNGNRTYIPNAFFDHTIRSEPLAVTKVVGAIIRHTIAFQDKFGFRRTHKALSFDDLLRITRLNSRSTLNDTIKSALTNRHIIRLEVGTFGNGGDHKSTYGLCWEDGFQKPTLETAADPIETRPVQKPNLGNKGFLHVFDSEAKPTSSKSEPRTSPKSEPRPVQKPHQDRSKNRTYIEITKNNTLKEQQQKAVPRRVIQASTTDAVVVVFRATSLLKEAGFQDRDAIAIVQTKLREISTALESEPNPEDHELLAATRTEELIQKQIKWLPKRSVSKSKLGMLRAAIEGDFADPESTQTKDDDTGLIFAKTYYAAYTGSGKFAEPFPRDPSLAAQFLESLNIANATPEETGRNFGRFVRERHASDRNAKPFLSTAINMHGDAFAKMLQAREAKRLQDQRDKQLQAHEQAFQTDYREYLKKKAADLKAQPKLLQEFEEEQDQQAEAMKRLGVDPKKFMTAEGRIEAIADHFRNHKKFRVLPFWEWDQKENPKGYRAKAAGQNAQIKTGNP